MNHRVADLNACGKAIEEDAANLGFKHANKFLGVRKIFFGAVNRGRQVAVHFLRGFQKVVLPAVAHEQCCRSEDFLAQIRML